MPVYLPHVDGLRGVAVLAIVLFHIYAPWLPGGFVGVDVFFTISGFLITHHICADLDRGRFSLREFYRRRIKRIMPAMLVTVTVTVALSQWLMLPEDAILTAKSAFASIVSMANVFFWRGRDTAYFAITSEQLPLLHLWSLGVEEQFYLVWPLLLLVVYRAGRTAMLLVAIAIAALASFLLAEWLFDRDSLYAYYMLPTRAGELLLGAMVALAWLRGDDRRIPARLATPLAIAGLLLIALSCALLTGASRVPGLRMIPPTLGTALIILASLQRPNPVSRALSWRPLVWVGLISYSAYLWHWPLLAFYRYGYGDIGLLSGLAVFVLTIALGWLMYAYVEQPARRSTAGALHIFIRQLLLPGTALAVVVLLLIYHERVGVSWPPASYRAQLDALQRETPLWFNDRRVCLDQRTEISELSDARCVGGADMPGEPQAVLWGDSNAGHYVGMLDVLGRQAGFRIRNIGINSCPPVDGPVDAFVEPRRRADCLASRDLVRPRLGRHAAVLLAATWSGYDARSDAFLPAVFATVRQLVNEGRHVILLGKVPDMPGYDRLCRSKALHYPFLTCPAIVVPPSPAVLAVNARLRELANTLDGVDFFDPIPYLCPQGQCSLIGPDGLPRYFDNNHLSFAGSMALGRAIVAQGMPASLASLAARNSASEPIRLIYDTDIGNDVDDAMALGVIHALQTRGVVTLLAVTVTKDHPKAAPLVDVLNTFYGRGAIPIGVVRDGVTRDEGRFLKLVDDRARYPHDLRSGADAPEAVALLRRTLAAQPDGSVTLVQVGFFTNLARLLASPPDGTSPLTGVELVRKKVKQLSVMAGSFQPIPKHTRFLEFNVKEDIRSAQRVVKEWPTPIVWSGFEIGVAAAYPHQSIEQDFAYAPHHPVKDAYYLYEPPPHDRPTWDLTAVLAVLRPEARYFTRSPSGRVDVADDGYTSFVEDPKGQGRDRFLVMDATQAERVREALVWLTSTPPPAAAR